MEKTIQIKHPGHTWIDISDTGITIRRKGAINAINQGFKGDKTIPFSSITAVQLKKPGLTNGYIQFSLMGGNESRGGVFKATQDENTVMYGSKKLNDQMAELKSYIEQKIQDLHAPKNVGSTESVADQLIKLKGLLDAGVLTQDEFDNQKAKLLAQ